MLSGTAHAFTAIVGSGILALPWSVAQLGWILGLIILVAFAAITYYTAILLSDCYRTPDPINGSRNYTYMDAVRALLGMAFFYFLFFRKCYICVCVHIDRRFPIQDPKLE